MADESKIAAALYARLKQYTAHPIAWPNETFSPPGDHRYVEPRFVPNSSDRIIDGPHRQFGLLQINVHWSKKRGEVEPRQAAEAVAALFSCDAKIPADGFRIRITEKPDVRDLIIDAKAPDAIVPIIIQWECRA